MVIFVCKCIKKIPNYTQSILQFLHFPKNLSKEVVDLYKKIKDIS